MKFFILMILFSMSAFADECCTGTCWTTGCCDPRQRCTSQNLSQKYQCVNIIDSTDKIRVKKTGTLLELLTTSSGI